jgi:AcrR family transcriptional regulator
MTTDEHQTPGMSPTADLAAIEAEVRTHAHGRVPRELRRRQVLAVAEQLFVERGYAATSMDDVAAGAGVTKPIVYDLVGSKDQVFEACMARAADALAASVAEAVLAAEGDDAARLRAGALAWFRFIGERRALWDALLASDDAPASAAIEAIRTRQDDFVAAQLAAGARAEGRAVDDELVGAVASAMNGAFEALGRWWSRHPEHGADELADLYTALVLPGLEGLLDWPAH